MKNLFRYHFVLFILLSIVCFTSCENKSVNRSKGMPEIDSLISDTIKNKPLHTKSQHLSRNEAEGRKKDTVEQRFEEVINLIYHAYTLCDSSPKLARLREKTGILEKSKTEWVEALPSYKNKYQKKWLETLKKEEKSVLELLQNCKKIKLKKYLNRNEVGIREIDTVAKRFDEVINLMYHVCNVCDSSEKREKLNSMRFFLDRRKDDWIETIVSYKKEHQKSWLKALKKEEETALELLKNCKKVKLTTKKNEPIP